MHPPTLFFGLADASTDSNFGSVDASTDSPFWVGGCIRRLNNQSQWMHPPTQKIFFESVDASANPKIRVGVFLRRPKIQSPWMHPPTQTLKYFLNSLKLFVILYKCVQVCPLSPIKVSSFMVITHNIQVEIFLINSITNIQFS